MNPGGDPGTLAKIRPSSPGSPDSGLDLGMLKGLPWILAVIPGLWRRFVHLRQDLRILPGIYGCRRSFPGFWRRSLDSDGDPLIPAEISGLWPESGDAGETSLDSSRDPGILAKFPGFQRKSAHPCRDVWIRGRDLEMSERFPGIPAEIPLFWRKSLDSNRDPLVLAEFSGFWPGSLYSGGNFWIPGEVGSFRRDTRHPDFLPSRPTARRPPEEEWRNWGATCYNVRHAITQRPRREYQSNQPLRARGRGA